MTRETSTRDVLLHQDWLFQVLFRQNACWNRFIIIVTNVFVPATLYFFPIYSFLYCDGDYSTWDWHLFCRCEFIRHFVFVKIDKTGKTNEITITFFFLVKSSHIIFHHHTTNTCKGLQIMIQYVRFEFSRCEVSGDNGYVLLILSKH